MTMKKILFVCHGNICRSPMAEFVLKALAAERGLDWEIASAATSREELGNDIHPGTKAQLKAAGIPFSRRRARQITERDYQDYDLLLGMDRYNLINMKRFFGSDPEKKLGLLMDFTDAPRDIADPWYSGDFDTTYREIRDGCAALLSRLNDPKPSP